MAETETPLERAIRLADGMASLARKLNERFEARKAERRVKAPAIYQWTLTQVPAEYCPDVEALTGVKCEELRPDVNWSVLRKTNDAWSGAERRKQAKAS
jgi:hypothetical protein